MHINKWLISLSLVLATSMNSAIAASGDDIEAQIQQAQGLYSLGKKLIRDGDFKTAEATFSESLNIFEQAAQDCKATRDCRYSDRTLANNKEDILQRRADVRIKLKEYKGAKDDAEIMLSSAPESLDGYWILVEVTIATRDSAGFRRALDKLETISPSAAESAKQMAEEANFEY